MDEERTTGKVDNESMDWSLVPEAESLKGRTDDELAASYHRNYGHGGLNEVQTWQVAEGFRLKYARKRGVSWHDVAQEYLRLKTSTLDQYSRTWRAFQQALSAAKNQPEKERLLALDPAQWKEIARQRENKWSAMVQLALDQRATHGDKSRASYLNRVAADREVAQPRREERNRRSLDRAQWTLLQLGNDMGFRPRVSEQDAKKSWRGQRFSHISAVTTELPASVDSPELRRSDIVWMEGERLIAVFVLTLQERLHSDLLRLSDLAVSGSVEQGHSFLVCPAECVESIQVEFRRLSFKRLSLSKRARMIEMESLQTEWGQVTKGSPMARYDHFQEALARSIHE